MTDNTTDQAKEADTVDNNEAAVIDDTIITAGSLGKALKRCREGADMDLAQAAQEMRLPKHVLKSLEAENFADLPEAPYVRGYLRSYSRLNESDPNELIRRFEILRGADPDDITSYRASKPLTRKPNKPPVSSNTIKLAGLSMLVLFLGLLSMIPAVSQWATDTWKSFSAPQADIVAADKARGDADGAELSTDDSSTTANTDTDESNANSGSGTSEQNTAASTADTASDTDSSETLALNQQDNTATGSDAEASTSADNSDSSATDSATNSDRANQDENTADEGSASQTAANDNAEATDNNSAAATATQGTADDEKAAQTDDTNTASASSDIASANEDTASAAEQAEATDSEGAEAKTADSGNDASSTEQAADAESTAQQTAAAETAAQKQQQTADSEQSAPADQDNFQQPIDGNVLVKLVFTQDVWMSIKSGPKQKKVFEALTAGGTTRQLKTNTPLKFKVGNAQGVKVYLNGQLVDQRPYTRGNVATFSAN